MGAISAAPYAALPAAAAAGLRNKPSVRDWPPLPREASPLVSVIVPARNEGRNIERCIRSLLASTYPDFEVVVVDDRSMDSTAAVAERVAKADARVRVVRGEELPAGWFGKPWACWQGYKVARGSLLLFTDADTRHGPALLGHAVAGLRARSVDLVTVLPFQECLGFWERVIQPQFVLAAGLMIGILHGSPEGLNRSPRPSSAVANGQFILVTRESYEASGGHEAVYDQVVEDLAIAHVYAKAGRPRVLAGALEDMTTRMYGSLAEIREGWTKNLFIALRQSVRRAWVAYLLIGAFLLGPLFWLAPPVLAALGLALGRPALAAFGLAGVAGSLGCFPVVYRCTRTPILYALFYPLGVIMLESILLRAMWRGTKRIEWKGRVYRNAGV